jgi:hypothetical protein
MIQTLITHCFVLFDSKNVSYQHKNNKIAINISINENNKMH